MATNTNPLALCVYKTYEKESDTVFIPSFVAIIVKSLEKANFADGQIMLYGTLVFRFMVQGVEEKLVDVLNHSIAFRLNETPITLKKGDDGVITRQAYDNGERYIVYTYRWVDYVYFRANLDWTPFDNVTIPLRFEMTSKDVDMPDKTLRYRFNFHYHPNLYVNISFKQNEELEAIADFNIAYPLSSATPVMEKKEREIKEPKPTSVDDPKKDVSVVEKSGEEKDKLLSETERKEKEEKQKQLQESKNKSNENPKDKKKVKQGGCFKRVKQIKETKEKKELVYSYFPIMEYTIMIFRNPFQVILTTLLPILAVKLLILAVYAQSYQDLAAKIQSLATLTLAIFAYVPTVRSDIPTVPYFTFTDTLLYNAFLQCMFCLLDAVISYYREDDASKLPLFIISASMIGLNWLAVGFLYIKYLIDRSKFVIKLERVKQPGSKFNPNEYICPDCKVGPSMKWAIIYKIKSREPETKE